MRLAVKVATSCRSFARDPMVSGELGLGSVGAEYL
jgi:hypothetical protein